MLKKPYFVLTKILQDVKNSFIQNVPDDSYGCLNCKETYCSKIRWESCEDRIRHIPNTSVANGNDKDPLEAEAISHHLEEKKRNI